MLAGVLSKIGVLQRALARVPTEVSLKENNRKRTFASTLWSTPILERIAPASILGSYFGVFPFQTSLPGQEVPYPNFCSWTLVKDAVTALLSSPGSPLGTRCDTIHSDTYLLRKPICESYSLLGEDAPRARSR